VGLEAYRRKRDFTRSPEPRGEVDADTGARGRFVVQKHAARRLHYDVRLELDGVLKSWAVPKGPSLVAGDRRLAAETEDHPLEYADFEGVIPAGEYGSGSVLVWDQGTWEPLGDPHEGLAKGDLGFRLFGGKLRGRWHLVRMRPRPGDRGKQTWLMIKGRDTESCEASLPPIVEVAPRSVLSGRDLDAVARERTRVWSSAGSGERLPEVDMTRHGVEMARAVMGARRARLPARVLPQLATLVAAPPDGDAWVHELKLDGYRLMARLSRGEARLVTRTHRDWTDRFPSLAEALRSLPVKTALLDGEVVVLDARGRSDFQALQRLLAEGRGTLRLFLFDLLHIDGIDLSPASLVERKRVLRTLLESAPAHGPLHLCEHVVGRGPAFLAEVCRSGAEGVVSKRADAPYRSGRSRTWVKAKCTHRQELVIAGFTDPARTRDGFGALLLAAHDASGALRYAGKVGTGFDTRTLLALRARLDTVVRKTPPVVNPPRARGLHWVEPTLVAEIAYSEWTRDAIVRQASFVGLREDKPAAEVRFERPVPLARDDRVETPAAETAMHRDREPRASEPPPLRTEVAGVRLSTPDRVYFPDVGVTKSELAQYWERVAERALPLLSHRPLSLVRCPESIDAACFYQKRADRSIPERVARVVVRADRTPYAMVTDLPSLIALVQVGTLELHVWGARGDRLDRPDLMVMDLDPDPALPWARVVETARLLRDLLDALGLVPFVRATGGKGLHVVVPLERRSTWDEVKGFAQALAHQLVRAAPDRFVATITKAKRTGKVLLDYFRNDPEATAIASWSPRARPGAPVAVPLAWDELDPHTRPFISLRDAPARLAQPDPWADFEAARRRLSADMRRRVDAMRL
jgi:bifunctional non-homologous end joining protein LigD